MIQISSRLNASLSNIQGLKLAHYHLMPFHLHAPGRRVRGWSTPAVPLLAV